MVVAVLILLFFLDSLRALYPLNSVLSISLVFEVLSLLFEYFFGVFVNLEPRSERFNLASMAS